MVRHQVREKMKFEALWSWGFGLALLEVVPTTFYPTLLLTFEDWFSFL
jgi:hypothetical protein